MSNLPTWQEADDKAVAISRALAMDAVQKVGNGHPGTAMSLAPVAYTLFQRILKHDQVIHNGKIGIVSFSLAVTHL